MTYEFEYIRVRCSKYKGNCTTKHSRLGKVVPIGERTNGLSDGSLCAETLA